MVRPNPESRCSSEVSATFFLGAMRSCTSFARPPTRTLASKRKYRQPRLYRQERRSERRPKRHRTPTARCTATGDASGPATRAGAPILDTLRLGPGGRRRRDSRVGAVACCRSSAGAAERRSTVIRQLDDGLEAVLLSFEPRIFGRPLEGRATACVPHEGQLAERGRVIALALNTCQTADLVPGHPGTPHRPSNLLRPRFSPGLHPRR